MWRDWIALHTTRHRKCPANARTLTDFRHLLEFHACHKNFFSPGIIKRDRCYSSAARHQTDSQHQPEHPGTNNPQAVSSEYHAPAYAQRFLRAPPAVHTTHWGSARDARHHQCATKTASGRNICRSQQKGREAAIYEKIHSDARSRPLSAHPRTFSIRAKLNYTRPRSRVSMTAQQQEPKIDQRSGEPRRIMLYAPFAW